jgi:hypothetical protein
MPTSRNRPAARNSHEKETVTRKTSLVWNGCGYYHLIHHCHVLQNSWHMLEGSSGQKNDLVSIILNRDLDFGILAAYLSANTSSSLIECRQVSFQSGFYGNHMPKRHKDCKLIRYSAYSLKMRGTYRFSTHFSSSFLA